MISCKMEPLTLSQVVEFAGGTLASGDASQTITRISTDSRTIEPGDLFVPIRGEKFDAHAFVGYETVEIETQVTALRRLDDGRVAVMLRESPFYAESGGQVSDRGEIEGDGWRLDVDDVRKVEGRPAAPNRRPATG